MRLAFFTPLNPQPSGIADYSEELLPSLGQNAEIDLFIAEHSTSTNPVITSQFAIFPSSQFAQRHQQQPYDLCLYQMGNNTACHRYMDAFIQAYPGIVTLHDYALHHFYADMFTREQRTAEYQTCLEKYYGELGQQLGGRLQQGLRNDYVFYQLPFYQRVVNPSLGTIVHSRYVQQKLLQYNPTYRVAHIPMGIVPPDLTNENPADLRRRYNFTAEQFIVASFGFLIEGKRLRELLPAFARFAQNIPDARCVLVGAESPDFDIRRLIQEWQIADKVIITGYVPYQTYFDYIRLADVCVNLRYPTVRATSANILKIMACAKPVIISDLCELLDLPSATCVKIPLNDAEIPELEHALQRLYTDPAERTQLGQAARRFVETEHSLQQAATQYLAFCADILKHR